MRKPLPDQQFPIYFTTDPVHKQKNLRFHLKIQFNSHRQTIEFAG